MVKPLIDARDRYEKMKQSEEIKVQLSVYLNTSYLFLQLLVTV